MDERDTIGGVENQERRWGGSSLDEVEKRVERVQECLAMLTTVVQSLVTRVEALEEREGMK